MSDLKTELDSMANTASIILGCVTSLMVMIAVVGLSNTKASKADLIKEKYTETYFKNMWNRSGAPIGVFVSEDHLSFKNFSNNDAISSSSKDTSNSITIDLSNTNDFLPCSQYISFRFFNDSSVISKAQPELKECVTGILKKQTVTAKNMQDLSNNAVVNQYKDSNPEIVKIANQAKTNGFLSNYDAIQIYVLAYTDKKNEMLKSL